MRDTQVWVTAEWVRYLDPDTNRLRLVEYREFVADAVRTIFSEIDDLRTRWRKRTTRDEIVEALAAKGIDLGLREDGIAAADLRDRLIDALATDPDPDGDGFTFAVGPATELGADEAVGAEDRVAIHRRTPLEPHAILGLDATRSMFEDDVHGEIEANLSLAAARRSPVGLDCRHVRCVTPCELLILELIDEPPAGVVGNSRRHGRSRRNRDRFRLLDIVLEQPDSSVDRSALASGQRLKRVHRRRADSDKWRSGPPVLPDDMTNEEFERKQFTYEPTLIADE